MPSIPQPLPLAAAALSARPPSRRRLLRAGLVGVTATGLTGLGLSGPGLSGAGVAAAAGPNHRSEVLRVPDPSAPYGYRPTRVAFADPADVGNPAVPVVYFLHGLPGTGADLERSGAAAALFAAIAALRQRLVLVTPAGSALRPGPRQDTEWGNDVRGEWRLESWVAGALHKAVEGTGRGRRAPVNRIVAGFSMGGFGAAMIGMKHPTEYGSVAAIAGYFHLDDPDGVFGTNPATQDANRPDMLIIPHGRQRFFLADGDQDGLPLTRPETDRFAGLLRANGISPTVLHVPGGHDQALVTSLAPALAAFVAAR